MFVDGVVTGQQINPELLERARQLRSEMTPEEKVLWNHLRSNRIDGYHFRRQQIIDGYIVDFYCHAAGLVIEVDGQIHKRQQQYDRERDEYLKGRGLTILHIKNDEINDNIDIVINTIKTVLEK